MAIVAMKRLHILALEADRDRLFDDLQRLGCVEVSEPAEKLADPEWAALVHPDESSLSRQQSLLEQASAALTALDQYAPEKKKLLSPLPQVKASELLDNKDQ